jgi:hypothetical protein
MPLQAPGQTSSRSASLGTLSRRSDEVVHRREIAIRCVIENELLRACMKADYVRVIEGFVKSALLIRVLICEAATLSAPSIGLTRSATPRDQAADRSTRSSPIASGQLRIN